MTEKLDVIIFGASGFTGKYTVFEAASVLENLKWGIAGRNRQKLEDVLRDMGAKANKNLMNIPIIIADIENEASIVEMTRRCKVLVNCCGPYRFYGERVVKACLETGTHQVDVSGEKQYMETMQLKYNEQAQQKNIYIISACGFDSMPAEMGVAFVESKFDGIVNSVESYVQTSSTGGRVGGASIHYGTWESAVHAIATKDELHEVRAKLFKEPLPVFKPLIEPRPLMFRSDVVNAVCLPFPGPDADVVMRSQRFLYQQEKKRPIQMRAYLATPNYIAAIIMVIVGTVFGILSKFTFGRNLLLKYPKFFSLGMASHEGPTEEAIKRLRFTMTFKASGWPQSEANDQFKGLPSKTMLVKVTGPCPGYATTCVSVLSSAITILKENDKMPSTGGVLPPGAAFYRTHLIDELQKHEHGMKFQVV